MTSLAKVKWCEDLICGGTLSPVTSGMGDCLRAGKLSHYVTSHPGNLAFRPSSVGKWVPAIAGKHGTFRLRIERVGVQVKLRSIENLIVP